MQVQKDEIRTRIIDAARREFLKSGYTNTSMRNIAISANITVGNIYAYFDNKEALFDYLIQPALSELKEFTSSLNFNKRNCGLSLDELTGQITSIYLKNQDEFLILMNSSKGSKYESTKDDVTDYISYKIKSEVFPLLGINSTDGLLAKSVALSLISGLIFLFNSYQNKTEYIETAINNYMKIMLSDIKVYGSSEVIK